MKKLFCLLTVLLLILCACDQSEQSDKPSVDSFSYTADCLYYEVRPGIKTTGFVNTEKTKLDNAEQALKLAEKECSVEYDTVKVSYDEDLRIYRISFYKEDVYIDGGDQTVYINQDGVTQLIVYGE